MPETDSRMLERSTLLLIGVVIGGIGVGAFMTISDPAGTDVERLKGDLIAMKTAAAESEAAATAERRKQLSAAQDAESAAAAKITAAEARRRQAEADLIQAGKDNQYLIHEIEDLRAEVQLAETQLKRAQEAKLPAPTRKPASSPGDEANSADDNHESEGFALSNVSFADDHDVIGEIHNRTGKDWETAGFTLSIYDANGRLTEVINFWVDNIRDGQTKPFDDYSESGIPVGGRYVFQFDDGH